MSSDNTVAILKTPKGNNFEYRVAHQMAIENYQWDDAKGDYTDDPQVQIKNAREMWRDCPVFTTSDDALIEAKAIYDQVVWTEYGISFIIIDAEF